MRALGRREQTTMRALGRREQTTMRALGRREQTKRTLGYASGDNEAAPEPASALGTPCRSVFGLTRLRSTR